MILWIQNCLMERVESAAESMFLVYNLHNSKVINIFNETANDELYIVMETLAATMKLHFTIYNRHWHFTTNTLFKTSGLTVQKMLQKKMHYRWKKTLFIFTNTISLCPINKKCTKLTKISLKKPTSTLATTFVIHCKIYLAFSGPQQPILIHGDNPAY